MKFMRLLRLVHTAGWDPFERGRVRWFCYRFTSLIHLLCVVCPKSIVLFCCSVAGRVKLESVSEFRSLYSSPRAFNEIIR